MEEEEDLKAILIRSIKHSKKVNLVQYYFPLNSEDLFKNQLLYQIKLENMEMVIFKIKI